MHRIVEASRRNRGAYIALGFATALALGFSASANADDIACHGSEKPAAKAAVKPAPSPESVAAILARVRVIDAPQACPAIDIPESGSGLYAAIDPETGQLRQATAEEMRALRPADRSRLEKRAVTTSEPIALPNGGVAMVLGDEYLNDVAVRIDADGTIVYECAKRGEAGKAPATAAKKQEEK